LAPAPAPANVPTGLPNKLTVSVLTKSDKNQDIERFDSAAELYASWDE
jgi:hypothetical protein